MTENSIKQRKEISKKKLKKHTRLNNKRKLSSQTEEKRKKN